MFIDSVTLLNEIAKALVSAQKEISAAEKDKTNPHFRSDYATLQSIWEACRDSLTKNNLCVTQTICSLDGKPFLNTKLIHISGQSIESSCPLLMGQPTMQALGSALTYARRYALAAIVGVVIKEDESDDDGQIAKNQSERAILRPELPPKTFAKQAHVLKLSGIQQKEIFRLSNQLGWKPNEVADLLTRLGQSRWESVPADEFDLIIKTLKGDALVAKKKP